jgi:hypothetical protein
MEQEIKNDADVVFTGPAHIFPDSITYVSRRMCFDPEHANRMATILPAQIMFVNEPRPEFKTLVKQK